jgi:signal transduction histidine kinase
MWGVDQDATPEQVIADLIVDDDRHRAEQAWGEALRTGRPVGLEYAIRHGHTGELRHLQGTVRASLGPDGVLLSGETTQVDVTDLVRARELAQEADAAHRGQRDLLFRQVSELLATSPVTFAQTLQATADLAATAIGDGCVARSLNDDGSRVETLAIAHRTAEGRALLDDWVRTSPTVVRENGAVLTQTAASGVAHHGVIDHGDPAYAEWAWGRRYVIAPAVHHGQVRGTIGLFRPGDGPPYDDADLDLLRVLADRLGTLLEAERAGARGRQLTAELQAINSDQRALVLQLDSAESRERGRLADAVHDEPVQIAVAAALRLHSYRTHLSETDPGRQVIGDIAGMLESCVDQLRTLMVTLTPPDLSSGLGPALKRLAAGIFLGTDVSVHVRGADHVHLASDTKDTIYRILREALINARKHAHATSVTIDLTEDDEAVTLRLTDDGVGMVALAPDSRGAFGHLGMSSMRARAAAADARLTITGGVGTGTEVELVVPLHIAEPTQVHGELG